MTVKELIDDLKRFNNNAQIYIVDSEDDTMKAEDVTFDSKLNRVTIS